MEDEFHVFIGENPLYIATMALPVVETFLKMAPNVGIHPEKIRHFHVKLVKG